MNETNNDHSKKNGEQSQQNENRSEDKKRLPRAALGYLESPHPKQVLRSTLKHLIQDDFSTTVKEFHKSKEKRCCDSYCNWHAIRLWFLKDIINLFACFVNLGSNLITFEFLVVIILSMSSTLLFNLYSFPTTIPNNTQHLASKLNFTIIASAFIFPVTFLVLQTFIRRQKALGAMTKFKVLQCNIMSGLLGWNWANLSKRKELPEGWEDNIHKTMLQLSAQLMVILKLPAYNRNRHFMTSSGGEFRKKIKLQQRIAIQAMTESFLKIQWSVEDLKQIGLPPQESIRFYQYLISLQTTFEKLLQIKNYRTPTQLRGFVRVFIVMVPPFYGPYYSWVMGNNPGQPLEVDLPFSLLLSFVMTVILISLVAVYRTFEDPFIGGYGDVIDCKHEYYDMCSRLAKIHSLAKKEQYHRCGRPYVAEYESEYPKGGIFPPTIKPNEQEKAMPYVYETILQEDDYDTSLAADRINIGDDYDLIMLDREYANIMFDS